MNEKFKYQFDDATKILYKYYYGIITLDDIYSSWDYAIANNLIPKETKGFILDYRQGTFNIGLYEYPKIAEYYINHLEIFRNQRIAIITESMEDRLIPILVETKDQGYKSKPFSSLERAINWVLKLEN